ncbi:GDP-mannose 4,6-dehydratase [Crenothrix polyspora]|uniref:NAD-dependent epimerase/dehydratase n=1 Tax=Crenothrix polyspora TaxID=360316 RepID=A0A1R4GYB6_9GAMM|nr:GDP-mannose 4,6-dehydratase [Crenothrix polyspora]SJM88973.1 NAD-dependent epimerase/dehydratase [Crenothrix polyspora]
MTKALITGINGFTGRYLAIELQKSGYEVFGISHSNTAEIAGVKSIYTGDLNDTGQIVRIIQTVQPDVVVHLAAITFVAHGDIDAIYRTNVLGTRCLLEALVTAGDSIKAVLLASSANVYGNAQGGLLAETTPFAPANDYAVSKVAMEYVAQLYKSRLPITIVRPFNYTGAGQAEHFLIPKIVEHYAKHKAVIELGNLEVARDFSDVRTVASIYKRLLETPKSISDIFNVCSGKSYTLLEVINLMNKISGYNIEVRVNPDFVRANEVKILQGDRKQLENIMGSIEDIPLETTLRWMFDEAVARANKGC